MAEPLVADLVAREMLSLDEVDEVLELIGLHDFQREWESLKR